MKHRVFASIVALFVLTTLAVSQDQMAQRNQTNPREEARIQREVGHELAMLPYFTVFDNIAYRVDGSTVTLMGQVVNPVLKSDAGNAVKHIEGVDKVDNQIEVLPLSPIDNHLRLRLFRAIYGYPALQRYALGVQKPIRIIVKNGHVTLEGVVDSDGDRNIAGIRANGVPGVFSVTNNLQVQEPEGPGH